MLDDEPNVTQDSVCYLNFETLNSHSTPGNWQPVEIIETSVNAM